MKTIVAVMLVAVALFHAPLADADTFGSGANRFDIEFVRIGEPGNATHPTVDRGSVPYVYRMGKDLHYVHISDVDRLPPCQGRGDFIGLVQALNDIGYDGFLSMEIGFNYRNAQPDKFAREAYEYMKPLLDEGHIYLARPPLYKITSGKHIAYAWDDAELAAKQKELPGRSPYVQRFKGLGEMNADELAETTMAMDTRKLMQVTIEDAVTADHTFSLLLGDKVEPRRAFIEAHAREVKDLDV